ncbi:hypothetical protein FACS189461_3230 [Spirochaetia bacterium]|nr:hypothetical protein FACS189461_3230 [Spirochaetia bacterium]
MDATIQRTAEKMEFLSSDKEVLRQYRLRNMGLSDITTAVNTGIEKKLQEIAEKMRDIGLTPEQINRVINDS